MIFFFVVVWIGIVELLKVVGKVEKEKKKKVVEKKNVFFK